MTRYRQIAKKEAERLLKDRKEPMTLFSFSSRIDGAVQAAGKKADLYDSLFDYVVLLPAGWETAWLKVQEGSSDSLCYVVPKGFQTAPSKDLLLGGGTLVRTQGPLD